MLFADSSPVSPVPADQGATALTPPATPPPRLAPSLTGAALVSAAALSGAAPPAPTPTPVEATSEPSIQQALEALRHTQSCAAANVRKTRQAFDSITAATDSGAIRTTKLRKRA